MVRYCEIVWWDAGRELLDALDGYVRRIVDRDLPEAGRTVRQPATVRAWLRSYAAATATSTSWEKIRDAATAGVTNKPSRDTTTTYTDLLIQMAILDPIEAWVPGHNHLRRLGIAPKHHLADPAIAARLLGQTRQKLLFGDAAAAVPKGVPLLGNLFESLVALTVRISADASGASVYHLRDHAGAHEIDFIIESADGGVVAIEAKLGGVVDDHDVRHLHWLRNRIGHQLIDTVVVNTGADAYRRADGTAVVPLALLGP